MNKDTSQLGSPHNTSLREYVVTLKDHNDSDGFYEDMETEGGNITIPNRSCECCNRRPASRNTHYHLTWDEARQVLEDDRVLTVELSPEERGMKKVSFAWTQTSSNFSKKTASDSDDINWGLVRSLSKTNISNWGTGGVLDTTQNLFSELSGKDVDVVIMDDGAPYPSTLEYQQNEDGTGHSRMIQYNWYQHNPAVNGSAAGVYDYSAKRLQEHGAHTTGTVAGNTQGWARNSNIYNLTYYDDIQYVKEFHLNKPINPKTGLRNPTVMNNSWGYRWIQFNGSRVASINYRGVNYTPTSGDAASGTAVWDPAIIAMAWPATGSVPTRDAATDADFADLIAAGVICVASAGNSDAYVDVYGGIDYNNYYVAYDNGSYYTIYYNRGSSPAAADGVICVGAAGSHNNVYGSGADANIYGATSVDQEDYRAEFSNYGPRIDIWAAGSGVQSIWSTGTALYDGTNAPDPRLTTLNLTDSTNNNFKKCPGTSMSGPQVAGVLACIAEAHPRMSHYDARDYLRSFCPETMQYTTGGYGDDTDIGISKNPESGDRYLYLKGHRVKDSLSGQFTSVSYPDDSSVSRPQDGQTYPRGKKFISGNKTATYSLSSDVSSINATQTATITLTTTNVPDGTKIPYVITSGYKGQGSQITTDTGIYQLSDASNTYVTSITGDLFGDSGGQEKRHKINMSSAANPTWIDDPNGFSSFDFSNPPLTPVLAHTVNVSIGSTVEYDLTGSDRIEPFTNSLNKSLTFQEGDTIDFVINATGMPFYIVDTAPWDPNFTTPSAHVVAGIANQGAENGTITWIPAQYSYGTYYYVSGSAQAYGVIDIWPDQYPGVYTETHPKFTGTFDDGFLELYIPWTVNIFGTPRNKLYVSTNSYITWDTGSTAYSNLTTLSNDKMLLSAGDGAAGQSFYRVYGTAPNRYIFFDYYGNSNHSYTGQSHYWEGWLYENDPDHIYISVLENGRRNTINDTYPFYQDQVLGGESTTGQFVVNNNSATLQLTPTSIPPIIENAMNINVRLDFYGTPEVNITAVP